MFLFAALLSRCILSWLVVTALASAASRSLTPGLYLRACVPSRGTTRKSTATRSRSPPRGPTPSSSCPAASSSQCHTGSRGLQPSLCAQPSMPLAQPPSSHKRLLYLFLYELTIYTSSSRPPHAGPASRYRPTCRRDCCTVRIRFSNINGSANLQRRLSSPSAEVPLDDASEAAVSFSQVQSICAIEESTLGAGSARGCICSGRGPEGALG